MGGMAMMWLWWALLLALLIVAGLAWTLGRRSSRTAPSVGPVSLDGRQDAPLDRDQDSGR
jgi:hypothetical protein